MSQFVNHLVVQCKVAASTQIQALNAMVFLYRDVVVVPLGEMSWLNRVQQCKRIPIVTTLAGKTKLVEQSGFGRMEDGIISDEAGVCNQYPTGVTPFREKYMFLTSNRYPSLLRKFWGRYTDRETTKPRRNKNLRYSCNHASFRGSAGNRVYNNQLLDRSSDE